MKIAVFYHIKPSGEGIDKGFATEVFQQQMGFFKSTGLADASNHTTIGINGIPEDAANLSGILPKLQNIEVRYHGKDARSEIPTLKRLQQWLPGHADWYVCYWHAKGITHPHYEPYIRWRRCMEHCVIKRWQRCMHDLERGHDSVGAHWLDRTKYPRDHEEQFNPSWNLGGHIWGGNFWWAKAQYLLTLPELPSNSSCRGEDFAAEIWIGSAKGQPKVIDYAPHFPTSPHCGTILR